MSLVMEWKKVKRTGIIPAFLCGGILAALVPVLNMAVRSENYVGLPGLPVEILLNANWQMMAMLNMLFAITGACILYNMEYADRAILRLNTLPVRESRVFFGKFLFMAVMCAAALLIETVSIGFCLWHWFGQRTDMCVELVKNFGFFFLLMLPAVLFALLISSASKNMWISLGAGVVCMFLAILLPAKKFVCAIFPFALPLRVLSDTTLVRAEAFVAAAVIEMIVIGAAELIFLKVRRYLA